MGVPYANEKSRRLCTIKNGLFLAMMEICFSILRISVYSNELKLSLSFSIFGVSLSFSKHSGVFFRIDSPTLTHRPIVLFVLVLGSTEENLMIRRPSAIILYSWTFSFLWVVFTISNKKLNDVSENEYRDFVLDMFCQIQVLKVWVWYILKVTFNNC